MGHGYDSSAPGPRLPSDLFLKLCRRNPARLESAEPAGAGRHCRRARDRLPAFREIGIRTAAKVESVSEQAERVTDPGAARNAAAAPATATKTRKSTIANTQEWLLAILTTLVVTYFLLAAGPSLLVKIEASGGARRINMRLVRLAAAISDDLSRYGTGLRRGGAHRTRRGGAQRAADSVLRERVGGRGYGPIERTRRLTAAACCRIERDRGQRAARGRPGLTSAGFRDRYAPAQLRRRSARARRRGPLPSSSPRTRSAEPRPSASRR